MFDYSTIYLLFAYALPAFIQRANH